MNDYCSPDSSLAKWLRAFLGINRGGFMYVSQHSLLQLQEASTGGWAGTGGGTLFGVAPALGGPGPPAAGELYLHFHHVDGVPAAFDFL